MTPGVTIDALGTCVNLKKRKKAELEYLVVLVFQFDID